MTAGPLRDSDPSGEGAPESKNHDRDIARLKVMIGFIRILRSPGDMGPKDEREGPQKGYYPKRRLGWEVSYRNGEPEGPARMYYENGRLWAEAVRGGAKAEWEFKEYYEDGQLKSEGLLENGCLGGSFKEYCWGRQPKEKSLGKGGGLDAQLKKHCGCGSFKNEPDLGEKKPTIDIQDLLKNLYFCFMPKPVERKMYCVDSSDKSAIGSSIDIVDYEVYWVNNSAYDVPCVVQKGYHGDHHYGKLGAKGFLRIGEYPHWMFDWENGYDFTLWLNEKDSIILNDIKIPKFYRDWDKNPFIDIPVLNRKGHNVLFSVKECSA